MVLDLCSIFSYICTYSPLTITNEPNKWTSTAPLFLRAYILFCGLHTERIPAAPDQLHVKGVSTFLQLGVYFP